MDEISTEKIHRKSIIDLSNTDALEFLLKTESYSSAELPPYFVFEGYSA